jgi:hypothetical protein
MWGKLEASSQLKLGLTAHILNELCYGDSVWVPNILKSGRDRKIVDGWRMILVKPSNILPGDFVIFWGASHVGTSTGKQGVAWEGNSGNCVALRKHSLSDVTGYVRLVKV